MTEPKTIFPLVPDDPTPPTPCPTPTKRSFETRDAAEKFESEKRSEYGPQRVYSCQCGQYHLTTREECFSAVPSSLGGSFYPVLPADNPELQEKIRRCRQQGLALDAIVGEVGEPHTTVRYFLEKIDADVRARQPEAHSVLPSRDSLLPRRPGRPIGGSISSGRPTLESISARESELEAQLRKLKDEKARLIEEAKVRVAWIYDRGQNMLMLRHNGRSAAFPLESWREAVSLIAEQIRQVDAGERLLPGTESAS